MGEKDRDEAEEILRPKTLKRRGEIHVKQNMKSPKLRC